MNTITPGKKVTYTGGRKRSTVTLLGYREDGRAVIAFDSARWMEFPVPAATIEPYRDVVRTWHMPAGRCRVQVETRHPQAGPLYRGTVRAEAGAWRVVDHDGTDLGLHHVDYIKAEKVLLDATAALDEPYEADEVDG